MTISIFLQFWILIILIFITKILRDIQMNFWELRTEHMKSRMELEMAVFYLKVIEKKLKQEED